MKDIVDPAIEDYCARHTTPLSGIFSELKEETYAQMTAPHMQVGILEGSFLKMLVTIGQARRVLEVGTFTGYSALAMAEGLPAEGKLITCDVDPRATEMAKKYWARSPHGAKIELKLGPALETIESLSGEFDFAFIDADKGNYINYWEAILPRLRIGGLIAVDNVLWSGRVLDPQEKSDHHIVDFNAHARKDPRVEIVMLTIRDGILLARRIR